MAADTIAAADALRVGIDPNTACPAPLNDAVANVAEIVAAWLDVAIEAAGPGGAETFATVETSMAAGSGYVEPEPSCLCLWQKTAGKPPPYRPFVKSEDTVMSAADIQGPMGQRIAEYSSKWTSSP